MLSNKIPTVLASSVVLASFSVPCVASAATIVHTPGKLTQVHVVRTATAAPLKEAGSAGVSGYDDAKCEGLMHDSEVLANNYFEDSGAGDKEAAAKDLELFKHTNSEMNENCLVVD
jgi:hypothetical protein